jgi:hypothetical protein
MARRGLRRERKEKREKRKVSDARQAARFRFQLPNYPTTELPNRFANAWQNRGRFAEHWQK